MYFHYMESAISTVVWANTVLKSSGVHRPPGGQGQNGVRMAQSWTGGGGGVIVVGVGDVVPPRLGLSQFYHNSLSCWFFYFASCLSITANLSQTNFPIIKTKHFKVTKYKKVWQIFRPKWVNIKIFVIIL